MRAIGIALCALIACVTAAAAQCDGDFNGDGMVTVNELVTAVNNALNGCGRASVCSGSVCVAPVTPPCDGDFNGDGMVVVNELIIAVTNALNGCTAPSATPTPLAAGCPFDFDIQNLAGDACRYVGTLARECGTQGGAAGVWRSDGSTITALIADGSGAATVVATRESATAARVTSISIAGIEYPATGTLSLPSPTEFRADATRNDACTGLSFAGTFFDLTATSGADARSH